MYGISPDAAEFVDDYEDVGFGPEDEGLEGWSDEPTLLAETLRDALRDEYSDASPEELEESLGNVLGSMSPGESFNFAKALQQIETGAQQALSDPAVGQIVRAALPVAGGAVGTIIGGPAGTALGSGLGNAAAGALAGAPKPAPASPARPAAMPPVAGGSAAAAQGLILTQQPDVLKALLALALGQHGRTSVSGVPVAQIMNMLGSVFGQAAADADELLYVESERLDEADDVGLPSRPLYITLMDGENAEFAEIVGP